MRQSWAGWADAAGIAPSGAVAGAAAAGTKRGSHRPVRGLAPPRQGQREGEGEDRTAAGIAPSGAGLAPPSGPAAAAVTRHRLTIMGRVG